MVYSQPGRSIHVAMWGANRTVPGLGIDRGKYSNRGTLQPTGDRPSRPTFHGREMASG
jgi:hypothetical protein